jgi:hypothetical protein
MDKSLTRRGLNAQALSRYRFRSDVSLLGKWGPRQPWSVPPEDCRPTLQRGFSWGRPGRTRDSEAEFGQRGRSLPSTACCTSGSDGRPWVPSGSEKSRQEKYNRHLQFQEKSPGHVVFFPVGPRRVRCRSTPLPPRSDRSRGEKHPQRGRPVSARLGPAFRVIRIVPLARQGAVEGAA